MLSFSFAFLLLLASGPESQARVRTVELKKDQIVSVRTALGIATIVQVPDRPNSLVVGDQNSFKVEYLDQAITIKPLHGGARSNLYIYTDYRRFNVQLITGSEAEADFVVYLEPEREKQSGTQLQWRPFPNRLTSQGVFLATKRIARTKDGVLLVEFEISSERRIEFVPGWLWLTQGPQTRPIHSLALSGKNVAPGVPIMGVLQILKDDLSGDAPLRLEMRRGDKISYLTLPKVDAWK